MTLEGQIRWVEGLFLQPHHFQHTQRQVLQYMQFNLKNSFYPYGVIEMKISDDQLNNHIVSFDSLKAVMPSGVVVDFPCNSILQSLNITDIFSSTNEAITISLALPLWYSKRSNVCEGQIRNVNKHFCVEQQELYDDNIGEMPEIVDILKYNARLVTNFDDTGDIEILPLIKIIRTVDEDLGMPKRDNQFIPACFTVGGSHTLNKDIKDIFNKVIACRNEAWSVLKRSNISLENMRGLQFKQIWKMRTLNQYAAIFKSYLPILHKIHPFNIYLIMRQMISELSVFYFDNDLSEIADYNHDNLGYVFKELANSLRSLIIEQTKSRYVRIKFNLDNVLNMYIAKVDKQVIEKSVEYFLCIITSKTSREVVSTVINSDKFKFMPKSISHRPIYGIRLEHEICPPPDMPTPSGACYFRILSSESGIVWSKFVQEGELAIHWPEMSGSDYDIHLYAVMNEDKL